MSVGQTVARGKEWRNIASNEASRVSAVLQVSPCSAPGEGIDQGGLDSEPMELGNGTH